jgi:hypothetical protein
MVCSHYITDTQASESKFDGLLQMITYASWRQYMQDVQSSSDDIVSITDMLNGIPFLTMQIYPNTTIYTQSKLT